MQVILNLGDYLIESYLTLNYYCHIFLECVSSCSAAANCMKRVCSMRVEIRMLFNPRRHIRSPDWRRSRRFDAMGNNNREAVIGQGLCDWHVGQMASRQRRRATPHAFWV